MPGPEEFTQLLLNSRACAASSDSGPDGSMVKPALRLHGCTWLVWGRRLYVAAYRGCAGPSWEQNE